MNKPLLPRHAFSIRCFAFFALLAAISVTPHSSADTLYVGSNTPNQTINFTTDTNEYTSAYVGYDANSSDNALSVANANTLLNITNFLVDGYSGHDNAINISDAATIAADSTIVGYNSASSNNGILVSGTNSLLLNTADLYVGYKGSGNSLTISNGATVSIAYNDLGMVIGVYSNSLNNSVLVTGTNSLLTNAQDLFVGNDGSGNSLTISNGATAIVGGDNYYGTVIGLNSDSLSNSVTVSGTGSLLENDTTFSVGYNGSGNSLTISNGATVTTYDTYIGQGPSFDFAPNNNAILVTGTNSLLNNGGDLFIGYKGSGNSLTISNGATVSVTGFFYGTENGSLVDSSSNSVTVTGVGTLFTNSDDLYIGYSGSGNRLIISNGATVSVAPTNYPTYIDIGENSSSSNNAILVTGTSSVLADGWNLNVGVSGSGNSLTISNGATTSAAGTTQIGEVGNSNSVTVTGVGSIFTSGNLFVGVSSSGNSLTISNGATVSVAARGEGTVIGWSSNYLSNSMTVTGIGSLLTNSLDLIVGYHGSDNSLTISNGATVSVAGSSYGMVIGDNADSLSNSVTVTGAGSLLSSDQKILIGIYGEGTLTMGGGASVVAKQGIILAFQSNSTGTLNIGSYGSSDLAGAVVTPSITFGDGTGTINFNQSDTTTLTSSISGYGTLRQLGSGTTILTGSNNGFVGPTLIDAGTLNVEGLLSTSNAVNVNGGVLAGGGFVGNVTVASGGTLYPSAVAGTNAATTLTANSVALNAGSTIDMNITPTANVNDTIASTSLIQISGGTLNLSFNGTFNTGTTTSWTLWTTGASLINHLEAVNAQGALVGSFTMTTPGIWFLMGTSNYGDITLNEMNGLLTMQPIPEPSAWALFGLSMILGLLVRRKLPCNRNSR
jgi:T5SS/PEP-CTERM-associated repeat protein